MEPDELRKFIAILFGGFHSVFQAFHIEDIWQIIFRFHTYVGHLVLGGGWEIWRAVCHLDEEFEGSWQLGVCDFASDKEVTQVEHGVLGRHLVLAIFVLNEWGEFLYYLDRIILSVDHHRHFHL